MKSQEKEISYRTTNSYTTLNELTSETKNIWFVCHGMGYLSKYFINYFNELNPNENYIIATQAQSKYYIPPKFKHVGACWLTKENTLKETENVMLYFDSVLEYERIPKDKNIIVLGYSQGVSVALRYVSKRKFICSQIAILSGGIPQELEANDFAFLEPNTRISMIYGTNDEYLNEDRVLTEKNRAFELFGTFDLKIIPFNGTHEVKKEIILQIAKKK